MREALTKVTELTMEILAQTIEFIATPNTQVTTKEYILDFLRNCDKDVYTAIRDYNMELKEATQIKPLQITCGNCSHQYKQLFTLNVSDFFA